MSPAWAGKTAQIPSDIDSLLEEGDSLLKPEQQQQKARPDKQDGAGAIILPHIYSQWAAPSDKDQPEITMDDISKCLGTDYNARLTTGYLGNEGAIIKQQSEEIQREISAINKSQRAIDAQDNRLSMKVADFNRRNTKLSHTRREIDRARARRNNPAQEEELDRKIDLYNRDLAKIRREKTALTALVRSQKARDASFNTSVQAYDKRVSAFNLRADTYRGRIRQFNHMLADYKARCGGLHKIK